MIDVVDQYGYEISQYLGILSNVLSSQNTISPRGMEIRECEDYQLTINPDVPFMTFKERKYNVQYFKEEMKWKLTGNKYDESIKKHAKMWEKVQNPDGTFNSNYGQYWFGEQMGIWNVINELLRDNDSRRAVIPMLDKSHITPQTIDTVCTESVGFRIRHIKPLGMDVLNMSVHMRSSDIIYGLGTDIPTFSFLYRLVFSILSEAMWPYGRVLYHGNIKITAMSSHIYAHHYDMAQRIIDEGPDGYQYISMPWPTGAESIHLVASRGKVNPKWGPLSEWLVGNEAR